MYNSVILVYSQSCIIITTTNLEHINHPQAKPTHTHYQLLLNFSQTHQF